MNAERISRPRSVRIGIAWRFGFVVEVDEDGRATMRPAEPLRS